MRHARFAVVPWHAVTMSPGGVMLKLQLEDATINVLYGQARDGSQLRIIQVIDPSGAWLATIPLDPIGAASVARALSPVVIAAPGNGGGEQA